MGVTFTTPVNVTWPGGDPPGLEGGQAAKLLLEAPNGTTNLLLRTADNWTFYQAPVDLPALQEAAERALDVIRAGNDGELPDHAVQVTRPNATSGNATGDNATDRDRTGGDS